MRPLFERFVDAYVAEVEKYVIGDSEDECATLGPLAQRKAVEFMEFQVQDAVTKGARVLTGGKRLDRPGYSYQPTVLVDVNHSMSVMWEESFGSIVRDHACGQRGGSRPADERLSVWSEGFHLDEGR